MILGIGNSPSLLRSQPPHGGGQGTDRPPTRFHHRTRRAYGLLPPALPLGELSAQLTERGKAATSTTAAGGADIHVTWGETVPVFNWSFNIFDVIESVLY